MKFKRTALKVWIGALALVGSLILGVWLTAPSASAQPYTAAMQGAHQRSAGAPQTSTAPQGIPAIPKTDGALITKDDVIGYVQTHGMPSMSTPAQPFVVTRVELLRSDVITSLLNGEIIGTPDEQLLWYVEVDGIFTRGGPAGAPLMTFHHGVEVFDPATGNLLLLGGRP